jgi:small-conductance mechanosensitive channel/CRP-like cAMP-binding protein
MMGLSDHIAAAVRDPLVLVLGLFAVGTSASHLCFKRYPLWRAILRVVFLVILTIALLQSGIVPYQPLELTGSPLRDAVRVVLKIAWWLWAAWFVVGFVHAFVIVERRPHEGKLLRDLLAGLVYLAAALAIIAYVLDLPIQGLLATSGVVAIILGLALQSTLGDVFSGIVLNFSQPYRPGDWISLEGGTDGRVIEMNWRATHVLTGRRDLAIVPNSTIAKSKIVNVSSPSGMHGTAITVQLATQTSPSTAIETLEHAILNCRLIVSSPSPVVAVKTVNAAYTEFELTFFVEELASTTGAQNELFDLVFRHLTAAGIELASPQGAPYSPEKAPHPEGSESPTETVLGLVAIFAALSRSERAAIAAKLQQHSYDRGDILLEPGKVLQSLFIIGSGVVSFTHKDIEAETELLRLGPGDHYGEIGLLTGDPSTVTITAITPVITYELAKSDLAPILKAQPQVEQELSHALARRQAAGRCAAATDMASAVPTRGLTSWFSEQLHRLYNIASAQ